MIYKNTKSKNGPIGSWEANSKSEAAEQAGLREWINAKFGRGGAPDSFSFGVWWNGFMESLESE